MSNAQLAYVTGSSAATNEQHVMAQLMPSFVDCQKIETRWLTLSGADAGSTTLTERDFGKCIAIDTQIAAGFTHSVVLPAASKSTGARIQFQYRTASAVLTGAINFLCTDTTSSLMSGLIGGSGTEVFVAGSSTTTNLSLPALLVGSGLTMTCDGKAWWVQGNVLATTPAFA